MTTGKDTASFFENGTTAQFEYCYNMYPQVLKKKAEKRHKKPQELIRLDEWYQNQLPKLIKGRGKDAHMEYDELVQTMKWKQSRGKFYPQLSYLVKVNTPRAVMQETKKAFRKLPNLEQAITALSNLKGVGTTMASALLAAAAPDFAPFMADECLMAIPEIEGIDYTTKEYLNFVNHIQATVARLNVEVGGETPFWSPHRVELALWSHYVANDLSPELLDEMPGPGAGGGANTNGSASKAQEVSKTLSDGNDDTNDADDESLRAAAGHDATNNAAIESEVENDNTNPAPPLIMQASADTTVSTGILQDGDSNFVSNDSTSQEPIIDENTTQTTVTTSTDDGEAGTPLASDSESNLEVPSKANNNVTSNANSSSNTAVVNEAPLLPNNTNSSNCAKPTTDITKSADTPAVIAAIGNSNGNGTLLAAVTGGSDGENSSCLRSSVNEEASDDDEEDDAERSLDDSSNSNSHGPKSVTPIINMNDGTNNTDNDSTLSSAGITIAQKRAIHYVGGGTDGALDEINSQPDMKKIRSD